MVSSAKTNRNTFDMFFLLTLSGILALCMGRDWMWDEATTYENVLPTNVWELFSYQKFSLANHHLINSLYVKILQSVGIRHVFFFRLLSVIGFIIFYFSNIQLFRIWDIRRGYIFFLVLAPYFTYFSQARGYALSIGFLSFSVLSLVKFIQSRDVRYEYLLVCSACLSALSIFSFFFASASVLVIYAFVKFRKRLDIHFFFCTIIFIFISFYIYFSGNIIQEYDPYIIGSDSMLKNGMLSSILSDFALQQELGLFQFYPYLKLAMLLTLLAPLIYLPLLFWRKNSGRSHIAFAKRGIALILIAITITGIYLSHLFFGAKYPLGRAILCLHYLLILNSILIVCYYYPFRRIYSFPFFFVIGVSCFQAYALFSDLTKPGIADHLKTTGRMPLYVLDYGNNPSLELLNRLEGIHKENIHKVETVPELDQLLESDRVHTSYLLCPKSRLDSVKYRFNILYQGKDNLYLLKEDAF